MCGIRAPSPVWCKVFLDIMTRFRQGYKSTLFFFLFSRAFANNIREREWQKKKKRERERDGYDCHTPNGAEPQSLRLEAASQPGRHLSVGNRTSDQVQRRLKRPPQAALYKLQSFTSCPPFLQAWSRLHLLSLPVCWGQTLPVAHLP